MTSEIEPVKRVRKPAVKKDTVKKPVTKKVIAKKPIVKKVIPEYVPVDTDYENPWYYKGKVFNSTSINDAHGFIYMIEELSTGKIYIGQKQLWTKKIRMINKKRKKVKAESDWKNYYSSSNYINDKVALNGISDFKRYILVLCCSPGSLNYTELKFQVDLRVLEQQDKFLNGYIGGRISHTHFKAINVDCLDKDLIELLYKLYKKPMFPF